jgi:large subunit ribosomal protein L18
MAKSSNYRVQLRRRREGKTDYQARKALVSSGRPRLVTRTALKNTTVQILIAKLHGDEVLAAANSRELVKTYGWKAPTGNIPAAYLTGYLCGLKAKAKGIEGAILDIGLNPPIKGAKVFAALKGVVDAGVEIPHSEEKIVKERNRGDHIAKYAKSLGAGSEEYASKFSQYTAKGVAPEKIIEHFNKTKAEIAAAFKVSAPASEAEEAEEEEEFEEFEEEEKPAPKAPKVAKAAKAPKAEKAEAVPTPKKAPVKKPAAKQEVSAAEEKAPAKKTAKKPAKEEAEVKEEKPKAAKAKAKAPKDAPKEKASKKGGKKA